MARRVAPELEDEGSSSDDDKSVATTEQEEKLFKVFDLLDMSGTGVVASKAVGSFISMLLWEEPPDQQAKHAVQAEQGRQPSTSAPSLHDSCRRRSASAVIVALTEETLKDPEGVSDQAGLRVEDVQAWRDKVDASDEVYEVLTRTDLIANVLLLRQFIGLDYRQTLFTFSFVDAFWHFLWYWTLPVSYHLAARVKGGGSNTYERTLKNVRLMMQQRILNIFSLLPPKLAALVPERMRLWLLPWGICSVWGLVVANVLCWWALYGPGVLGVATAPDFIVYLDPKTDVGFFEAHVPLVMLTFLIFGGTVKLSINDVSNIDKYAASVHDLGSLDQPIATTWGSKHWTLGRLLFKIRQEASANANKMILITILNGTGLLVPAVIVSLRQAARVVVVGNMAPSGTVFGPIAELSMLYCCFLLITFWWHEVIEIMRFLVHQRLHAELYSNLFSHGDAAAAKLPCLKNRFPKNIEMWAKLRFYIQKLNVIEMRWMELFVIMILLFVLTCSVVFFVTFFTGTLFEQRPDGRNTDLQAAIIFTVPILICLMIWVLFVVFTAVSIGNIYRDDLQRLLKEAFDCECHVLSLTNNKQPELGSGKSHLSLPRPRSVFTGSFRPCVSTTRAGAFASGSAAEAEPLPPRLTAALPRPDMWAVRTPSAANGTPLPPPTMLSEAAISALQPRDAPSSRLPTLEEVLLYKDMVDKLTALLKMSNEYIEILGVAIDTKFRGALFSLVISGIVSVVSMLASLISKKVVST